MVLLTITESFFTLLELKGFIGINGSVRNL